MKTNNVAQIAIVRDIPDSFNNCLTNNDKVKNIDVALARKQHQKYCKALSDLGVNLIKIESDEKLPDCCFTEDTAVVLDELAIITRPGVPERMFEIIEIEKSLRAFRKIYRIIAPGHLEGGDVVVIDKKIFIGESSRTNSDGIHQVQKIVYPYGYKVISVLLKDTLHLKSVCTYLGNGYIIMAPGHFDEKLFADYKIIRVPASESYCADTLNVNGKILIPTGFPKTKKLIESKGFEVISLNTSEIRKADGALTCLSVIFNSNN